MASNRYCIIMAGGSSTRFWPLSKSTSPKQFLDILGTGKTFIQSTYERFCQIIPKENIYVVTNEKYRDLLVNQLPELKEEQVLLEPIRRNTAPCIAYACYKLLNIDPEANIVVTPADHLILNESKFLKTVESALSYTENHDALMTLGIHPNRAETAYGYIQINAEEQVDKHEHTYKVKTFTEKPNIELAKVFVDSGEFYWNSGIFVWNLKSILNALSENLPEIDSLFRDGVGIYNSPKEKDFIANIYSLCRSISIDFGVMEKAQNVYVKCADFGWSDVGSWASLFQVSPKKGRGNAEIGDNIITYNTSNCIISNKSDKMLVVQGLNDYIVAQTDQATMIIPKSNEKEVKNIVADVSNLSKEFI
jgi:mannose-1-phosphate guanylyltransferase